MARRKHKKIAEAMILPNVIQGDALSEPLQLNTVFANSNPITLELGCGTGQYTISLARLFPDQNFVGLDVKGSRIWTGAKSALADNLANVRFLRTDIRKITDCITPKSVDEIWITFPDPYPRKKHAKHRLTSPFFLARYRDILAPNGIIHFKTDDPDLFAYTLEVLGEEKCQIERRVDDVYSLPDPDQILHIQTVYEKRHLAAGKKIMYVAWRF